MTEGSSAPAPAARNLLALNPSEEAEFKNKVREVKKRSKKHERLTPGVIYLGHIPNGFFEPQIRQYFSQFGKVQRLRLSRSKKTGGSKGYAFVEFECDEVAKIVADTMNNYLLRERLIKCHVIPPEKVKPELFKGSQTPFKKPSRPAVGRYNRKRTPRQKAQMTSRLLQKEAGLRKRLAEKGIDYDFPGFSAQVSKKKKTSAENSASTTDSLDVTPVCTPTVLEKRKSMKVEDSDGDDEIIIKATPAPKKSKGKKKMR
uniref:Nucleolar protein interacting with the FHA domain of MKI67 n=1 Tax=Lepisosteus oculatus TaxID=7918 RepID=W5M2A4_LEPOC|nr:PREDICTED: MKI67 FHA domain-interacting nucleolar phosphoprotein isoform X2 [Lepisosteus oculatus]XP_015213771.1 PREDICTED: MKI67 FHA domain-interacting nucleolar phosphoprotein isoform X1 [Lepisosteus oculatus]